MKNQNILTDVYHLQPGDNWTYHDGAMCTIYKVEPSKEEYYVDVYYIMFETSGDARPCKMTELGQTRFVTNRPIS